MSSRSQFIERCRALPAVDLSYPFGMDTAVFKISDKILALVDLTGEHGSVTVKADPGYAATLVARHKQVTPGYYMNKRHWITIELADTTDAPLPTRLADELLEDSYERVIAGFPARLRPTQPALAPAPARHASPPTAS